MTTEFETPLVFPRQTVLPEWIDFNGHMNVAYYMVVFGRCVDDMYNHLGIGPKQMDQTKESVLTLETHINYVQEVMEGDPLDIQGRLIDYDKTRIHTYFEMFRGTGGELVAAMEQLGIHVDMKTRTSIRFNERSLDALASMARAHLELPDPEYTGSPAGLRIRRHERGIRARGTSVPPNRDQ